MMGKIFFIISSFLLFCIFIYLIYGIMKDIIDSYKEGIEWKKEQQIRKSNLQKQIKNGIKSYEK